MLATRPRSRFSLTPVVKELAAAWLGGRSHSDLGGENGCGAWGMCVLDNALVISGECGGMTKIR